jgi:hypothetical protein
MKAPLGVRLLSGARRLVTRALFLLLALLPVAAAGAGGTTLYVNRIVVAELGDLSVGELLQASGDVPEAARETLLRSVAVVADKLLYVPTSCYRTELEALFGPGAIIVGSHSTVIPRGSGLEAQAYLVDRLVDWLLSQGMLPDAKTEIAVSQVTARGSPPQVGAPVFQARKGAEGVTDVTLSLSGTGGGSVTARVAFAAAAGAPVADSVRQGTAVNVIFHKGPITIEVPGKALGAASVGSRVSVTIADSQKSFSGQLVDGKAVDVDLP